jgi:glycosyltransferase involved in cell wall biosynthesis
MNLEEQSSLVSVIVLTYNSGKFVEETLESIKSQTYTNIELIISDDASNDNTVDICKKWLAVNKTHFKHSLLLEVPLNTGIPSNYNRGFKSSKGNWIKYISGDDCLSKDCIEKNMNYVLKRPDVKVLYSYNRVYMKTFEENNFIGLNPKSYPKNIINERVTATDQYKSLLESDKIGFTPTRFFARSVLEDIGLPDEDLYSEDFQLKLRMTKAGYKFYFMEEETILYRMHENAANNTNIKYILKPHYFTTENFRKRYVYPNVSTLDKLDNKFLWIVNQTFRLKIFNKKTKFNKVLFYLLNRILNPFAYLKQIMNKLNLK